MPKVPNSGDKTGGRFSHRAKNEKLPKAKAIDGKRKIIAREEKNTKRSYKKNQGLRRY